VKTIGSTRINFEFVANVSFFDGLFEKAFGQWTSANVSQANKQNTLHDGQK
jgi:hypothetical protein